MPKNWEFVLAAYLIWTATFGVYVAMLIHKSRRAGQALRQLGSRGMSRS